MKRGDLVDIIGLLALLLCTILAIAAFQKLATDKLARENKVEVRRAK